MTGIYPDRNGFTILEILVAIAILSIALIPMIQIFPQVLIVNAQVEQEARSAFLSQQKMEEVKGKILSYFEPNYSVATPTAFPSPDATFKYTISDDGGAEIKVLTVRVWYDKNGNNVADPKEQLVEAKTKVAKRY